MGLSSPTTDGNPCQGLGAWNPTANSSACPWLGRGHKIHFHKPCKLFVYSIGDTRNITFLMGIDFINWQCGMLVNSQTLLEPENFRLD